MTCCSVSNIDNQFNMQTFLKRHCNINPFLSGVGGPEKYLLPVASECDITLTSHPYLARIAVLNVPSRIMLQRGDFDVAKCKRYVRPVP